MNRAAWLGLWLLVLPSALSAAQANRAQEQRAVLDRDVPALLEKYAIPGVSIAQIEDGRLAFAVAYGMQSEGVPATPKTLYNIASLTKPISAEVVLRLASAGAFALDDPLDAFWSDPDIAGDERRKRLTPRINLSHQTGFPNWRRKQPLAFAFAPGTAVSYSGEGYEYVARFAEKKTGEGFEALAERLVFKPLGMTDTAYTDRPWFAGRIATPTAAGGKAIPYGANTQYFASDLVHTTPTDYAKFVAGVMKNAGLTSDIAAQRRRVQGDTKAQDCKTEKRRAACADEVGFGLGWEVNRFGDTTILHHGGRDEGVATYTVVDVTHGTATIVFTNSDNGLNLLLPLLERLGTNARYVAYMRSAL